MTHAPALNEPLLADWTDLEREFDRWSEAGRTATLWWRDDDAVTDTPALRRLLAIAAATPLALAVIPAEADRALAEALAPYPEIAVLQHGWRHANHAPSGEKKAELGAHRPFETILTELTGGRARLAEMFGARFLPVLTPPWNRFAAALAPLLVEAGFTGLSADRPRAAPSIAPGLPQVNTHADLIDWRAGAGFVGTGRALAALVGHLSARRLGRADPGEPTGILTHHLVQDEATGEFLVRLIAATGRHPAARWVAAGELFGTL